MKGIDYKRPIWWLLLYAGMLIAFLPQFVNMLRMVQFDVIPRDHYENMLLRLIGILDDGTILEGAPFGYRILNVLIAAPFYLVPLFVFRYLPDRTEYTIEQLRASQAIVITNYLCLIAIAVLAAYVIYRIYKRRGAEAMMAAIGAFIFLFFSGWYSLDIPIVLYICLILFNLHRAAVAIPLLLASSVFNEKIFLIFGILFALRLITPSTDKKRSACYLLASIVAAGLYYLMVRIVGNPFPEHQSNVARYAQTIWHNITTSFFTVRGLILNTLPTLLLGLLALANARAVRNGSFPPDERYRFTYQRYDYLVIPAYLVVCMIASFELNLGRLIVVLFPLYLFGAVVNIHKYLTTDK